MPKNDPDQTGRQDAGEEKADESGEAAERDRRDVPEQGSWTRSFPPGTVEGDDWMVDVLDDLHDYASTHDLDEIADTLSETRRLVVAHLTATRH